MDVERVEALVRLLQSARARELRVETEDWKVCLVKGAAPSRAAAALPPPALEPPLATAPDRARVTAPGVGIFRAADPRREVGDLVEPGTPLGAIESMKIVNPLISEVAGEV